ncbi:hypothetical protein [Bacillus sp. CRN 9]|uniref:hypothetical protein n=1 Tax=Cytobacillus horneckiae TaxID=549687 RepID=UPI00156206BE|nr:hypothetical protein [Bacillus sp. CRN 9]
MKKFVIGFLFFALMSGCSSSHEANNADKEYKLDETNTVRLNSGTGHRSDNVKEFSMYEQNPNLLNTNGDKVSERSDIGKARGVIEKFTDYEPGAIWIDGEQMNVTVYTQHKFNSDEERNKAKGALQKKLVRAVPTYYVDVKIREDYTE